MNKSRGALAVTLVIVIFIMVVLATITMVSVGNVRQSADDVRIVAGVVQFSILAKAHKEANSGSYGGFDRCLLGDDAACRGRIGPGVRVIVDDIAGAYVGSDLSVKVNKSGSQYCVGATLGAKGGTLGRCVDSDEANTADQDLFCSDTAKCEVVGLAVVVVPPDPLPGPVPVVPNYCRADLNKDGVITGLDVAAVAMRLGDVGVGLPEDLDGDGVVTNADKSIVQALLGTTC